MKKWKKYLGLTFLSVAVVGCSPGGPEEDASGDSSSEAEDGQTTIRFAWWGNDERHDITQEAIELFEEENPDIVVEPEYTGWDSYWERLTTQAAGDNLPAIVQMDNSKLTEYISSDLALNLNDLIDEGTINMEDVSDVYQDMLVVDDSTYAISAGSNGLSTIYNQELFEDYDINLEPGYTYDDLHGEMERLSEEEGEDFWGYDFVKAEYETFFHYVRQFDQHFYNEDGTGVGFENETLEDFLSILTTWMDEGVATPHDVAVEINESGESMVANEEAGMASAASNGLIGVQTLSEADLGLNVMPNAADGEKSGNWVRPSMSFMISNNASEEKQEAAAKLIDFITNHQEANEILRAERGVPIAGEVRESLSSEVDETVQETFEFLEVLEERAGDSEPLPPPGEAEVRAAFDRMIENVKYKEMTIEEGVEGFVEEAEQILAQ
ncbi:multiple sugar transport system substrate-binding protein [Salibacterium salarium]|uniref:ABC transporter substrate-binding protein n=1 Tax=Salibacterium salarium TaxID=284579 RepID=UPI002785F1F0|nr:ABC transporter substrate-binding protein [Salibacterium salarium]MDQ0300105.1 multiple sugar transport system substrate-binding protein [Salibacterium salarium]